MERRITSLISTQLSIPVESVENTVRLLEEGATVPFITRYRKEMTRNLDEACIRAVKEKHQYFIELAERKNTILKSIESQGKLTDSLKKEIDSVLSKTELEDIYLPYKPSRKTRGMKARENGLLPLAERIISQKDNTGERNTIVKPFITESVPDADAALQGAQDIIAEFINTDAELRKIIRPILFAESEIKTAVSKEWAGKTSKYEMYYEYRELAKKVPSHRMLALFRGETEGIIKVGLSSPTEKIINLIEKKYIRNTGSIFYKNIKDAVADGFNRLLLPSLTTEVFNELKEKADNFAIEVFAKNLEHILLAPPLGPHPVLAFDPGFRTGIKIAVIDATAKLIFHDTVYPLPPHNKKREAFEKINALLSAYDISYIAVGNGTASRETEAFLNEFREEYKKEIVCVVVNEAGASVFSVSDCAREEFPDLDATVRGTVSIGRRFQDPLAELVKIDPKSLGIGQYQHDVNQTLLKQKLDESVEHCVNLVGVDLNTASHSLLSYTSGIGSQLAKNIVAYRDANGLFSQRKELLKVPKLGKKAYQQAAGFLRIRNGKNPLDASAIHPESYDVVTRILSDLKCGIGDLMGNEKLSSTINIESYVTDTVGRETLRDILKELGKPGRDPRDTFAATVFDERIRDVADLKEGMVVMGVVTNIAHFGVFVDLGVHQDGLIHISNLAHSYVADPCELVKVGQNVKVKVISIDIERKRIGLSLKDVDTIPVS